MNTFRLSLLLTLALLAACAGGAPADPSAPHAGHEQSSAPAVRYQCPMHPQVVQDHPGQCPICGMALNRVDAASAPAAAPAAAAGSDPGTVVVDPAREALIGIRTAKAERTALKRELRAPLRLAPDEARVTTLNALAAGRVEKLHATTVGAEVTRGRPLLELYSQDLYAAELEYVSARRSAGSLGESGAPLLAAARERLALQGVDGAELRRLEAGGAARRTIAITAPFSGVVTKKMVVAGAFVTPEMALFELADLSSLWALADFSEADLPHLRVGARARVSLNALPGEEFAAPIEFVARELDPATRTVTVRFRLANPRLRLRPGQLGEARLGLELGSKLTVPEDALVSTGARELVYRRTAPGRYEPVAVRAGEHAGGRVEILEGLNEGDEVAVSAAFLLDSESRMRTQAAGSAVAPAHAH